MSADPEQPGARKLVRPLEAVLKRPVLAILPVIVLTSVLVLVQMVAPAKYSAEGNLVFGSVDVAPNQLPGLVTAGQQLAATYARFLPAAVPNVAERLDISEAEVRSSMEATNVAQSPIITISATSDSQKKAVELVEVTMEEFKTYVDDVSGASAYRDPEEIRTEKTELTKSEFAQAVVQRDQARVRLNRLNGQVGVGNGAGLDAEIRDAVDSLVENQGVVDEIQAELDRLDSEQNAASESDPLAATVRPLGEPVGTGADTTGRLITSIAAGLVLGGLLGMALAMMSANNWNILDHEETPARKASGGREPTGRKKGEASGPESDESTSDEPTTGESTERKPSRSATAEKSASASSRRDTNRSRSKRRRRPAKSSAEPEVNVASTDRKSTKPARRKGPRSEGDSVDISDSKSADDPESAESAESAANG